MSKKSDLRLVKDGVIRIAEKHCEAVRVAQDEAQFLAAHAQVHAAKAQAAEAEYQKAVAQAIRSSGLKLRERAVVCFDCGLVRLNEPIGPQGQTKPCPECNAPKAIVPA